MLHLLRKHQYGIMLIVAIIVIVAFTFLYDPNARNPTRMGLKNNGGMHIIDRDVAPEEVEEIRQTQGYHGFLSQGGFSMFNYTMDQLGKSVQVMDRDEQVSTDFVMNVALMRTEARRLGIAVSDAEIEERIKGVERFQNEDKKFDPKKWQEFIDAQGGRTGRKGRTVYAALADEILLEKLVALIGHEVPPSQWTIDNAYNRQHQKLTASVVILDKKKFENQEVKDEEAQKYYDEHKESPELMSDEKRVVKYVLFPKPKDEELKDLDEAKKAEKQREYKVKAQQVSQQLVAEDRGTKTFDDIVKSVGGEVKTTPAFTQEAPPDELKDSRQAVQAAFSLREDSKTEVVEDPAKGYYILELVSRDEPKALEFAAAKEKIVKLLKTQKQTEAFDKAVKEIREKLVAALGEKKPLADAAKEAGAEVKDVPTFSMTKPPQGDPYLRPIVEASSKINVGELSEPVPQGDTTLLIYLAKRELPKDPKMEDDKKTLADNMKRRYGQAMNNPLFEAWFKARKEEARRMRSSI